MKQHLSTIHHHAKKLHEHIKKHAKKAHEHLKRHGKRYIYGHVLAASALFSFMLNYHSGSNAANIEDNLCIQTYGTSNIVLDYTYTDPKKDVILKGISFDKTVFPELVLVKSVKQNTPNPNNEELSTDRGDLASYTTVNKENPTEKEIAEYLSNSNLNNLIDGEGWGKVELDVEFAQSLSDNTSESDAVGEILIFERGMNSDMYIQPIDKLGGKELGTKLFLDRKDMIYAGFSIDTIEIGETQKMGYWRVDLSKLGVSSLKYIRISSLPANSGPDFKIIGLNTQKCEPKQLKPLVVESVCSPSPTSTRLWKITNPNDEDVPFTWDIYKNTQTGSSVVTASGTITLQASPITGPTILRTYVKGEIQNITPSSEEKCPIVQPKNKLTIEPMCSSDPESYRVWKVDNTNPQDLEFTWTIKNPVVCSSNKVLVCQVPPGNPENEHEICIAQPAVKAHLAKGSYLGACTNSKKEGTVIVTSGGTVTFTTPVIDDSQEVGISIDGVEHDTAKTVAISCPKKPVNDYKLSVLTDKTEGLPYQELTYTLQYQNVGPELLQSGTIDFYTDEYFEYVSTEGIENIEPNHYRITLPVIGSDDSGAIIIKGTISSKSNSGSSLLFKATLSGERDVNIDNNTVSVQTIVKGLLPLELSSLCSDNPSAVRAWRIQNPNVLDIPVDIYVNNEFSASVIAKANDFTYVKTNTVEGTNTISLYYNGAKQTEKSSENVVCPKPISDLAVEKVEVKMVSEDVFVAQIAFKNLGPNVSKDITIDVAGEDANFVVNNELQPEVQQTLQEMAIDETYTLSVTGALVSGNAEVAVAINGQTIDPNVYNNNSQTTVSAGSSPEKTVDDTQNQLDIHGAASNQPTEIQGYEVGEQVDMSQETGGDTIEDVIGLGCHYTDEEYENIKFQDIIHHRSKPYVELLRLNCIVKGREANTFVTDDYIKRAEAIKVAIKLRGINNSWKVKSDRYIYLGDTPMDDVNNAHWAAQYVDKAYQIGLLDDLYKGTTSKKIFPEQSITRGESVELLVKTYLFLKNSSLEKTKNQIVFADVNQDSSYTPYIEYAYQQGFIKGVEDNGSIKFNPDQPISRSEFAKITALIFKDFLPVYRIK